MVSESVQNVYNNFLCITRREKGLPFRPRKDFKDFEREDKFVSASRLQTLFSNNPHIIPEDFFVAPFRVVENFEPDIKFYTTLKAIKCYTTWQKMKMNMPPDSPEQLQSVRDSLFFLRDFCNTTGINPSQYLKSKEAVPAWLLHLKEGKINPYLLLGYDNFRQHLEQIEPDLIELYAKNLYENYYSLKKRFNASEKMRKLVDTGLKTLIIKTSEAKCHCTTNNNKPKAENI